jgi:molybdate transport system substrate-binding protein
MLRRAFPSALVLLFSACARTGTDRLTIAAASDLSFAFDDLSRGFRKTHPQITLETAFGSSGNFYAQIRSGAPYHLFLSADAEYPRLLARDGLAAPGSVFVYAIGRLVVWVPATSPLDPATALQSNTLRHVAIANPRHAPYGRAAEAALRSLGIYGSLEEKLVFGDNIAQTLQFVQSGAADAGVVALSLAIAPPVRSRGRYWEIPLQTYPAIEQGGAVLKDSRAARDFRAWLIGPAGREILRRYGFSLPGA